MTHDKTGRHTNELRKGCVGFVGALIQKNTNEKRKSKKKSSLGVSRKKHETRTREQKPNQVCNLSKERDRENGTSSTTTRTTRTTRTTTMATESFLFTSESVNEGHPGRCDVRCCWNECWGFDSGCGVIWVRWMNLLLEFLNLFFFFLVFVFALCFRSPSYLGFNIYILFFFFLFSLLQTSYAIKFRMPYWMLVWVETKCLVWPAKHVVKRVW